MNDIIKKSYKSRLIEFFEHLIGPVLGGFLLDLVDFATFGPIGIYIGFIMGFFVGFWITTIYKLPRKYKLIIAFLSGIYCTLPMTELIPIATLIGIVAKLLKYNKTKQNI